MAEALKARLVHKALLEQRVLEQRALQAQLVLLVLLVPQVQPVRLLAQLEALVLLVQPVLLAQRVRMDHQQRRSARRAEGVILVLSERQVLLVQLEAVEQAVALVLLVVLVLREVLEQLVRPV